MSFFLKLKDVKFSPFRILLFAIIGLILLTVGVEMFNGNQKNSSKQPSQRLTSSSYINTNQYHKFSLLLSKSVWVNYQFTSDEEVTNQGASDSNFYFMTRDEAVLAVDPISGKELWTSKSFPGYVLRTYPGIDNHILLTIATPSSDFIAAAGEQAHLLFALEKKTGKLLWQYSLPGKSHQEVQLFYLPETGRVIVSFRAKDESKDVKVRNNTVIEYLEQSLWIDIEQGNIVHTHEGRVTHQFGSVVVGRKTLDQKTVFEFIDQENVTTLWTLSDSRSHYFFDSTIYVSAEEPEHCYIISEKNNVTAISKHYLTSGKVIWERKFTQNDLSPESALNRCDTS